MAEGETAIPADTGAPDTGPASGEIASGPPAAEAGGVLSIDLGAIEANWRALGRRVMPAECAAVVKADAYGCGLEQVGQRLARAGCRSFFVADLAEARRLRAVAPQAAIYVLNGVLPNTPAVFAELDVRPVIGSLAELAEWDTFCKTHDWRGGAALHVDTGMNRLGISVNEAAALAPRIRAENHGITLVMSHLACAQQAEHPLNAKQIALFREVRLLFRGIPSSLANSSGIFLGSPAHCDMVRPGVALYGVNPTPGKPNPMRPVVELQVHVLQIRSVGKAETVGYDGAWTARHATRVAVIAAGYADGLLRSASGTNEVPGADALVAGKRCPFAGRISMDLTAIDIGGVPEKAVRRGDLVTLLGGEITVDDLADKSATIGYEVLTSLGRRYHRVYKS
jgi:alanine racemase